MNTDYFTEKYEKDELGSLKIDNVTVEFDRYDEQANGSVELDLKKFYEFVESRENHPGFDEIENAIIYSSVLGGSDRDSEMPSDFDVLLLTEDDYNDKGSIVVPEVTKEPEVTEGRYGNDVFDKEESIVKMEEPYLVANFIMRLLGKYSIFYNDSAIPLHLSYRSNDQFSNGVMRENSYDTVSQNAYREGVPMFGPLPDLGERSQKYAIEWNEEDDVLKACFI